jgi:hypothetical protein
MKLCCFLLHIYTKTQELFLVPQRLTLSVSRVLPHNITRLHMQREEYDAFCEDLYERAKKLQVPPSPPPPAPAQTQNTNTSRFTVASSTNIASQSSMPPPPPRAKTDDNKAIMVRSKSYEGLAARVAEPRAQHRPEERVQYRKPDEKPVRHVPVDNEDTLSARTTPCNSVTSFSGATHFESAAASAPNSAPNSFGQLPQQPQQQQTHHFTVNPQHQVSTPKHQVSTPKHQHQVSTPTTRQPPYPQIGTPILAGCVQVWPQGQQMTPILSSCIQGWPPAPQPYRQNTPLMQAVMPPAWPHAFQAPVNVGYQQPAYQQSMPHPMLAGPPQTMPHPMMFSMR